MYMGKRLGQETGLFLVYIQTKKDLKIKYTIPAFKMSLI